MIEMDKAEGAAAATAAAKGRMAVVWQRSFPFS
jgi:hypothetical protein